MITVVTFKWGRKYKAEHVKRLQMQVLQHYPYPFRFVCVTDDPRGLDCETLELWSDHAEVPNPTWPAKGPSCYRRLKLFEAGIVPGAERLVWLDLDTTIRSEVTSLWHRPEDVVLYACPGLRGAVNGSMVLLTPGAVPGVWRDFDPVESPRATQALGLKGSDQAWLTGYLQGYPGHRVGKWRGERDGIADYRSYCRGNRPMPPHIKIIFFPGGTNPWDAGVPQW